MVIERCSIGLSNVIGNTVNSVITTDINTTRLSNILFVSTLRNSRPYVIITLYLTAHCNGPVLTMKTFL